MILKNKIKKIIDAIRGTDINEIEISSFWGAQKIKMKKKSDVVYSPSNPKSNNIKTQTIDIPDEPKSTERNIEESDQLSNIEPSVLPNSDYTTIKAPLIGTFYQSPKPGEPFFVDVGSEVKKGATLCIIEAMKIFNEIESDYDGVIQEILVKEGDPVEYDQPLFIIKEI